MDSINNISQQILAKLPLYRLKDLIKAVRACKTAADERAVIQRESAKIRTAFKEENTDARHNNVAKLLYVHMLGYPAHFGQMECLKLVASPKYTDKRLGYLGIMLLIDEKTEVLTLVTNSLKNDLNHSNMYIVGLALCTLGNISSPEMARDLCSEVEKLMGSSNTYIRKKSALCALRIIRRVPELYENFISKTKSLLTDKTHGVIITGVTLATEMCLQKTETGQPNHEIIDTFKKGIPTLVRHLENLTNAGFSPEHDVTGISDPFLQVKVLRLLRILAKDSQAEETNKLNDILTKIATNTENSKNVGNAILYETVLTIMGIQSERDLRVLAINILGKFLSNRDNNIRYVALETLNKMVGMDTQAVQRHRNTILDCLRDGDISIRRRALELSFALINESNIRVLTRELLAFLEVADSEFKQSMTIKISLAADRFAPNKRWHIDTMLRMLKLAGNHVREENLAGFIRLIVQTSDMHQYAVQKLYAALKSDISQEGLVLSGVWVIGEFGDILVGGGKFDDEDKAIEVSDNSVVTLLNSILVGPYANQLTREYVLTAIMKLSTRLSDTAEQKRIGHILEKYSNSMEVEIQQRAVEYTNLFTSIDDTTRSQVLERMPVPEVRAMIDSNSAGPNSPVMERSSQGKSGPSDQDLLLDLMGVGTASSGTNMENNDSLDYPSTTSPKPQQAQQADLLADLFGGTSISTPQQTASPASSSLDLFSDTTSPSRTRENSGMDILSSFAYKSPTESTSPRVHDQPSAASGYEVYSKNNLTITLAPTRDHENPDNINIVVHFTNRGSEKISDLLFQGAVPKSQKLKMSAASSGEVLPNATEKQQMKISNPQQTPVKLRLRIAYVNAGGIKVEDMITYGPFPEGAL